VRPTSLDEIGSEPREKYGFDAGASARAFLALALWLSGDLPRARELIEEATRLASELGHPPTTANVLMYKITIETARSDFERVLVIRRGVPKPIGVLYC
jgi:hypothetical protein